MEGVGSERFAENATIGGANQNWVVSNVPILADDPRRESTNLHLQAISAQVVLVALGASRSAGRRSATR